MTQVIPLHEQVKALHPETGAPIIVVGIDATGEQPRLIVLHRNFQGVRAEIVDAADLPTPTAQ